jgi:hypothetical protein
MSVIIHTIIWSRYPSLQTSLLISLFSHTLSTFFQIARVPNVTPSPSHYRFPTTEFFSSPYVLPQHPSHLQHWPMNHLELPLAPKAIGNLNLSNPNLKALPRSISSTTLVH